jgi:hypothetical protein
MMDSYERLRDIPAQDKQRAEDCHVSISAYRLDPDDRRFPRTVELFMRSFAWGVLALWWFIVCNQIFLLFTGGR